MSRTLDTLGNDTVNVVFDNLGLQACGNYRERSSNLSEIMQIVTLAVRTIVVLTLSRRRSLFASAKFVFMWNIGRFNSTLMRRVLVCCWSMLSVGAVAA